MIWLETANSHAHGLNDHEAGLQDIAGVYNRPADFSRASELALFYNGLRIEEVKACRNARTGAYLPLDWFLDVTGANVAVYNPDDLLEAFLYGKKILVGFGNGTMYYDGRKIESKGSPVILGNHVLVPIDFFKCIEGLYLEESEQLKGVFLDYRMPFDRADMESAPTT